MTWVSGCTRGFMLHSNMTGIHNMTHLQIFDMTHVYVWHDSFVCVLWSGGCTRGLVHKRNLIHLYVWFTCMCYSLVCVAGLVRTCNKTHVCVWHDWFVCATWSIRTCDMTHSYLWHDPFVCVKYLIPTCAGPIRTCDFCVTWFLCDMDHVMCDMIRS